MAQKNFIKMSTEVSDGFNITSVFTPRSQTVVRRAAGVDMLIVSQMEVKAKPRMSVQVSNESDDNFLTPVQVCDMA
jgi:hypothetical protein